MKLKPGILIKVDMVRRSLHAPHLVDLVTPNKRHYFIPASLYDAAVQTARDKGMIHSTSLCGCIIYLLDDFAVSSLHPDCIRTPTRDARLQRFANGSTWAAHDAPGAGSYLPEIEDANALASA